jgi:hypothetical protein
MSGTSQHGVSKDERTQPREQDGVGRFEVVGLDADRELIRALAKRLTQDDSEASRIRLEVRRTVSSPAAPQKGGVLAALRRSPLVGAEVEMNRPLDAGRPIDL